MSNKTIAIVDLDSFHNQNIEVLLFACILEKKYKSMCVLDLNYFTHDKVLQKSEDIKEKGEILTFKMFDRTIYKILNKTSLDQNKLLNLAKELKTKSEVLLINANNQKYVDNEKFFNLADLIVVFADIEKNASNNILKFYLQQNLKNKKMVIVIKNYKQNVQNDKTYLALLKQFKSENITIDHVDSIPEFTTAQEIESIDPWTDIYKKINKNL